MDRSTILTGGTNEEDWKKLPGPELCAHVVRDAQVHVAYSGGRDKEMCCLLDDDDDNGVVRKKREMSGIFFVMSACLPSSSRANAMTFLLL